MADQNEKLYQLQQRLDKMVEYQGYFNREINQIRAEIKFLQGEFQKQNPNQKQPNFQQPPVYAQPPQNKARGNKPKPETKYQTSQTEPNFQSNYLNNASKPSPKFENVNWEKFIGENLISKIGIAILIIGVGIGAKFAIDNNWISPLMRIVFGYLVGLGLIGFAVKLKEKYLNFSSVLLSGGMATMYFITYFAYSYYQLISQSSAFALMLIFTIFTVLAALIYNRQVIAVIGLVSAYAVPFLLSENSGKIAVLLSYMAIINIGILIVSAYKYWKSLLYSSFVFTWIIFVGWYFSKYKQFDHFSLALAFLGIFFSIFYVTLLSYKLLKHKPLGVENIFLILTNSCIFFGLGISILEGSNEWNNYLGLFTIFNAFIHFGFSFLIKQFNLGDKTTFYLTVILALTFLTIALPIQTHGDWTTLFWTAEATILFWIGRTKKIALFENYSYPLMGLAGLTLLGEWAELMGKGYSIDTLITPIFNKYFVVGIFFVLGFGLINYLNRNKKYESCLQADLEVLVKFGLATVFLFALYNVFRNEIVNYFNWQQVTTAVQGKSEFGSFYYPINNPSLTLFNIIWQFIYTFFFLITLSWVNIKLIKSEVHGYANLILNAIGTGLFLLVGLFVLSNLRDLYLQQNNVNFQFGIFNLVIRYISIPFVLLLFWASYNSIKQEFINRRIPFKLLIVFFDLGFYFSLWIIVSSELLHWLDIFNVQDSYKLGLSILWGIYALVLIILGIYLRKTHLRIGAIVLFSLTLIKLFLYDLSDLGTISKTIVFVSLGILLLIISFLYTKYKNLIFEEEKI